MEKGDTKVLDIGDVEAQPRCRHHWMLERADGPISRGVCRFCGAEREFRNYITDCLCEGKELPLGEARMDVGLDTEPDVSLRKVDQEFLN